MLEPKKNSNFYINNEKFYPAKPFDRKVEEKLIDDFIKSVWSLICSKVAIGMVLEEKKELLISEGISKLQLDVIDSLISNNDFSIASCKSLHKTFTMRADFFIYSDILLREKQCRAAAKTAARKAAEKEGNYTPPVYSTPKVRELDREDWHVLQYKPKTESTKLLNREAYKNFKERVDKIPPCKKSNVGNFIKVEFFFFSGREKDLFASEITQQETVKKLLKSVMDYFFEKEEFISVSGHYGNEIHSWSLKKTYERKTEDVSALNRQLASFSVNFFQELSVSKGFKLFLDSEKPRPDIGFPVPKSVTRWDDLLPEHSFEDVLK
jgi:hypothetical protein